MGATPRGVHDLTRRHHRCAQDVCAIADSASRQDARPRTAVSIISSGVVTAAHGMFIPLSVAVLSNRANHDVSPHSMEQIGNMVR
jgi:hypothetical protein